MTQTTDLRQLERKAWTSFHQDGLVDAFLGLLLIAGFLGYVGDDVWRIVSPILQLSCAGFLIVAKKLITVPRMGLVKFGPERRARRRKTVLIASFAVFATVALLVLTLTGRAGWISDNHTAFSILLGLGIALVFGFFAYMQDFKRLYLLGTVFAAAIMFAELSGNRIPILVGGVLATTSGLLLLTRFMRRYPIPSGTQLHSNG